MEYSGYLTGHNLPLRDKAAVSSVLQRLRSHDHLPGSRHALKQLLVPVQDDVALCGSGLGFDRFGHQEPLAVRFSWKTGRLTRRRPFIDPLPKRRVETEGCGIVFISFYCRARPGRLS